MNSLKEVYKTNKKKPPEGYIKGLGAVLYYKVDLGQSAYADSYEEKRLLLHKKGKGGEGFWLTLLGEALYNIKLVLRYDRKVLKST